MNILCTEEYILVKEMFLIGQTMSFLRQAWVEKTVNGMETY